MSLIINPYAFSGGVSPWTPAQIASLKFWYNETSGITGTTNCSQWNDISGNAYHITQATASSQPAINATGINGKRTIDSDGSDDVMTSTDAVAKALFQNQSAAWIAYVAANNDPSAALRRLWFISTASSANARFDICTSTTAGARRPALRVRRQDGDGIAVLNASAALDTNPHAVIMMMDWANGDGSIYIDGTLDASNTSLTSSGNTENTLPSAGINVMGLSGTGTQARNAEIVVGTGAILTGPEITEISNYFRNSWATP